MRDEGIRNKALIAMYGKYRDSFEVCVSIGRHMNKRKVSLSHVNETFNQSIQADYVNIYIRGDKFEVLNIVFIGTKYGE